MVSLSILAASLAGGVLSVLLAAVLSLTALASFAPRLIGCAVGYRRKYALLMNALSGAAMVAGGVLGFFALQGTTSAIAASFLYIAVADLVPVLQRERKPRDFVIQCGLLASGVGVVVAGHG